MSFGLSTVLRRQWSFSILALALEALALCSTVALCAPSVSAQNLESPGISAKVLGRNRGVEVSMKLPRSLQGSRTRRTLSVVLTRDAGSGPAAIAMFGRPGKSIRFRDRHALAGTFVYRAAVLNSAGAAGWSVPLTVVVLTGGAPPAPPSGTSCHDVPLPAGVFECPAGFEDEVVRQVNAARATEGAAAISANRQLNCSSRNHTAWMIQNNVFAHDGWVEFIRAAGYSGGSLGENIALGYPSPVAVMGGWLNSPGHRSNIMNGGFTNLGVSCLTGANGVPWWTQNFGGQ